MDNDVSGNFIIAVKVAADGILVKGSTTATCDKGLSEISSMNNQTADPDAFFSQSALKVEDSMMVVVNVGSNIMTMMIIDSADPTKLSM
ncbi:MAG: hypothetical protein Q9191_007834, partial [Dirinaria sp. TL-2023a]